MIKKTTGRRYVTPGSVPRCPPERKHLHRLCLVMLRRLLKPLQTEIIPLLGSIRSFNPSRYQHMNILVLSSDTSRARSTMPVFFLLTQQVSHSRTTRHFAPPCPNLDRTGSESEADFPQISSKPARPSSARCSGSMPTFTGLISRTSSLSIWRSRRTAVLVTLS